MSGDASGFARTYGVELLFEAAPQISKRAVLERLRAQCGQVEPLDRNPDQGQLAFVFPEHMVSLTDATIPAQVVMLLSSQGMDAARAEPALQQSWEWREARAVVPSCGGTLLVTDMMSSGLPYRERLALIHGAVVAALEAIPGCRGIHWHPSQQFIRPEAYLDSKRGEEVDPLYPAMNVRLYNIEGRRPGEKLMDTMGLAALGLPDLQCHFVLLNPDDVGRVLYSTAYYLFEHGDVIQDGHTVQGPGPDQAWVCQHEQALAEPAREVLDINPGGLFAAGDR